MHRIHVRVVSHRIFELVTTALLTMTGRLLRRTVTRWKHRAMGGGVSVAAAEAGSVSMPGSIRPVAGSASGHGQAGPVIKPADDVRASVRRAMEEGSSSMVSASLGSGSRVMCACC